MMFFHILHTLQLLKTHNNKTCCGWKSLRAYAGICKCRLLSHSPRDSASADEGRGELWVICILINICRSVCWRQISKRLHEMLLEGKVCCCNLFNLMKKLRIRGTNVRSTSNFDVLTTVLSFCTEHFVWEESRHSHNRQPQRNVL